MEHLGHVHVVQQHVRDAEHIGELLFLNAVDALPEGGAVVRAADLLAQLLEPARQEAAGAAGEVYKNAVLDTNEKDSSRHTILKNTLKSRAFTGLPVHPAEL